MRPRRATPRALQRDAKTNLVAARRRDRQWSKPQRSCFWLWPWGHIYGEWHLLRRYCQVCDHVQFGAHAGPM